MDQVDSNNVEATTHCSAFFFARDFATQHTLQFIESVTNCRPDLRILEVGCGTGHLAKALLDKGHWVLPIDVSEEAVAFAQSLGLPAKQTDVFGIKDLLFDCVLFARSLHYINPLHESLAHAALLLDKGGFVLLEDFAFDKMDDKTAVWFQGVQNVLAAIGITAVERVDIGGAFCHLMNYYSEHHLHSCQELIQALSNVLSGIETAEGVPYLYRYFVPGIQSHTLADC